MSLAASTWALDTVVGDARAKLVLWALADHAHRDGTGAWASVASLAGPAECSVSTARRRITRLLERGLIREGDQRHVAHIPERSRPVVYDLAMSEGVRAQWETLYATHGGSERRAAAARAGAAGGRSSAQARRGVNPQPLDGASPAPQGLQTEPGGVANRAGEGLHVCNPNQVLEPREEPKPLTPLSSTAFAAVDEAAALPGLEPMIPAPVADEEAQRRAAVADLTRLYADTVRDSGGVVTSSLMRAVGANIKRVVAGAGADVPPELLREATVAAARRGWKAIDGMLAAPRSGMCAAERDRAERQRMYQKWAADAVALDRARGLLPDDPTGPAPAALPRDPWALPATETDGGAR